MRVLACDPSLRNWGYVLADVSSDLTIEVITGGTIQSKPKKKQSKNVDVILSSEEIYTQLLPLVGSVDVLVTESPYGTQSASAARSLAACCALVGTLRSHCKEHTMFSPKKTKEVFTGNIEASKKEMVDEAIKKFPNYEWEMIKRNSETVPSYAANEHEADAIAVLFTYVESLKR